MHELDGLVNSELNAVSFVMDYVEFHFNGPVLRLLVPVRVERSRGTSTFPGPGARDALCELIGREVVAVDADDKSMVLDFAGEYRLAADFGPELRGAGGEAMHFMPEDGTILVW